MTCGAHMSSPSSCHRQTRPWSRGTTWLAGASLEAACQSPEKKARHWRRRSPTGDRCAGARWTPTSAGDLRRRTSRCAGGRQRAARQGGSAVGEASAAGGTGPPWTKASASGPSSSEMDGEEPCRRREGLRRRGGVRRHGGGGPAACRRAAGDGHVRRRAEEPGQRTREKGRRVRTRVEREARGERKNR